MKTNKLLFLGVFAFLSISVFSQVPQGVNYQAVARGASGEPLPSAAIKVRFAIQNDTTSGVFIWEELHDQVQTNPFGLFSVILGNGTRQPASQVALFSDIDWGVPSIYLRTWIEYQNQWHFMGTSKLLSVPYALTAGDLSGAISKLEVAGEALLPDEALFEVKNKNGQTVFAVYSEGVRVYVGDGLSKASKGGFAIGSFDQSKAVQEYFVVNSDCVRVYLDNNPAKAVKGGFAIGSFDQSKAGVQEYLRVTDDSTRISVSKSSKAVKGGFAIGSFDMAKSIVDPFTSLTPSNYFIGHRSGSVNTTGIYNSFVGYEAGLQNTQGSYNSFFGYQSGKENLDGNGNVFIGYLAGEKNTWGTGNIFLGMNSGQDFTGGYNNTFIGTNAGQNFVGGSSNIFIGRNAGTGLNFPVNTIPGNNNLVIGNFSALYLASGLNNVILGNSSGYWITSGYDNLFSGNFSGYGNTTGAENVFLGAQTGYNNTTGEQNVFMGIRSGYFNQTGKRNTFLGAGAGYSLTSGDGNVFVGAGAGSSNSVVSNRLFIENSASGMTGALIYGEFDNDYLRLNANTDIYGRLGVGKASASARVDIAASNWDVLNTEGDLRIGDGTYRFKIGVSTSGGGAGDVRITAHGGTNRLILGGGGKEVLSLTATQIYPWTDNTFSLGLSSHRWTTVYAVNGTINTSDARLKTNIEDIGYGIEKIMMLRPVSFNWKDNPDGKRSLGLLAQDVEQVIGEVVDRGTDQMETLGINYSELVPVLIQGIKEQQIIIDKQAEELNLLRVRLEQVEAYITRQGQK